MTFTKTTEQDSHNNHLEKISIEENIMGGAALLLPQNSAAKKYGCLYGAYDYDT